MATLTVEQQVQQIYIGLLGRAADKAGLDYWTNEITTNVLSIEQLRANIVNEQPEYTAGLGSLSRAQVVAELYQNLFERAAESVGLQYWISGDGASVNVDQLVLALSNAAGAGDRVTLDNKTEAATYYAANVGTGFTRDGAKAAVADVDGTRASVLDSKSATDGGTQNSGSTFTLTASATTGNLDVIDGTSGNDTFSALADGFLETGDTLNGGGGIDTVNARFTANDQTVDPTLSGIEKAFLQVDGVAGSSFTFDGADVTSELRLKNTSTAGTDLNTFSNVALTTTVGIEKGADTTDLTVAFAGATGTADTASLALNAALADTVTLAGVETLNVVGAAGTSTIGTVAAVNAATVNVSGAGVVNLTATDFAATVAVDASTSTGGVSVAAEAGSTLTFTGSAVADTVNMGGSLTSADKLDGGDGSDVLSVSTATSTINAAGVKGFEAINVSGSASITHDIAAFAANNTISNVILNSALAGNNLVTVSNLTSGGTLTLGGATALTATDDATVNIKDAGVAGSNSDVANIAIVGTAAVDFGDITIGDTETINIASGGVTTGNSIALLAVDKAASLVVTGDSELTITAFTGSAVLTSIDASATTGGFIMGAAGVSTSATLIKGGSGADTLIGNSGADIITGGAGADTLTGGTGADKFVIASTDSGLTTATADIIVDFATAADTLSLGTAGTAAKFFELNASTTANDDIGTVELAVTAANAATGAGTSFDGTVQYMFVFDATATGGINGYLVADNDLNGVADFAVELTGLAATGDVVSGDIVA